MGSVRMGPPSDVIRFLRKQYDILNFVETGTYLGLTAQWASQVFSHVTTIEYAEPLYQQAVKKYADAKNIEFLFGDTRDQLSNVINTLNSSALFWLDAHWSGGNTYGQSDTCPILDEIEIINRCKYDSFILIDDARLFLSPPPTPHRIELWPDITAIIAALNSQDHHRYTLVFQDVIIAVPQFSKQLVSEYVQQRNTELWAEHADQQNMLKKSLRNLGKVFSAQGKVDI